MTSLPSIFDSLIVRVALGRNATSKEAEALTKFNLKFDPEKLYGEEMSGIASRAGSLLQHVSMMVAAVSFFLGQAEGSVERVFLAFELVAYLVFALSCLRCLITLSVPRASDAMRSRYEGAPSVMPLVRPLVVMRAHYKFALSSVFAVTLVFAGSVVFHVFAV